MKKILLDKQVSVSGQITPGELSELADQGIQTIICNRPDGEAEGQTPFNIIEMTAKKLGMSAVNIPFSSQLETGLVKAFLVEMVKGKKIHAYCRTGNRSTKIYHEAMALKDSGEKPPPTPKPENDHRSKSTYDDQRFDVVIIGAGSGGVAVSASLLKRDKHLRIAIIDPNRHHYYQPGWTMVGAGVFSAQSTERDTASLIDQRVHHIKGLVTRVNAENNSVMMDNKITVHYEQLIVAPGLVLNWAGIEGLEESLGKHGVTSNYRYDLAPYTWELVQKASKGKAIFTQPPMPIKCAGAPQKAMYLSADHWLKNNVIKDIDIEFCNAGGVLFGVKDYVPALMEYIEKYDVTLSYHCNLVKVDGPAGKAWFELTDADSNKTIVCKEFDMLHVCPPQTAPEFVKTSELGDAAGWLDVDPDTLQHKRYKNIWGLGDVMNTTNAKTMAAARKQVPVVAENICAARKNKPLCAIYDGYGSCPLTVERGKIVLAEFCYAGRVAPTFPTWLINGKQPSKLAWFLKATVLPIIYWMGMLKGHEWLTKRSLE